jgi:hypothetical protein
LASEGTQRAGEGPENAAASDAERPAFDTSVAHIARVYDYWLGGKDNFAPDGAAAEQAIAAYPDIVFSVRANRAFLARAVRYLAGEAGIRQFLDIGTGIPASNNTHEVAQSVAPESRVVYVDNDHSKSGCSHGGPVVTRTCRHLPIGFGYPIHAAGGTDAEPREVPVPSHARLPRMPQPSRPKTLDRCD